MRKIVKDPVFILKKRQQNVFITQNVAQRQGLANADQTHNVSGVPRAGTTGFLWKLVKAVFVCTYRNYSLSTCVKQCSTSISI